MKGFTEYYKFDLSLSRDQVGILMDLVEGREPFGNYRCFVRSVKKLIKTGLVRHIDHVNHNQIRWEVTLAGRYVYALIKLC